MRLGIRPLEAEEASIDARDLFGLIVAARAGVPQTGEWDEEENNAFAVYLTKALARVDHSAGEVRWRDHWAPMYGICAPEAAAILGDDEEAVDAILSSVAALHEMPANVRKAAASERAQWARSEAANRTVGTLEDLEDLP